MGNRGKFARVAVAIDVFKPLLDRFELNGRWYRIEYEGLPSICFACGCVGHTKEICPMQLPSDPPQATNAGDGEKDRCEGPKTDTGKGDQVTTSLLVTEDPYGPWMQVRRPRRNPRKATGIGGQSHDLGGNQSVGTNEGKKYVNQGSRFAIFNDDNEAEQVSQEQSQMEPRVAGVNGEKSQEENGVFKFNATNWEETRALSGNSDGANKGRPSVDKASNKQPIFEKRPVTIGPLCHDNGEMEISAARSKDNKIRKMKASENQSNVGGGATVYKALEEDMNFHPGHRSLNGGMKNSIFSKPPKNRSGVILGKRKTDVIWQPKHKTTKEGESSHQVMEINERAEPVLHETEQDTAQPVETEDLNQISIMEEGTTATDVPKRPMLM